MLNPVVSQKLRGEAARREGAARSKPASVILHVDMDAFFASVEERDNPSLRGSPVIVGGTKGSRGIVTTCNYIARRYGVHSGMSLFQAERLCPDGIFLKTLGRKYTWVSLNLMELLRNFSPKVEPYSVDEAFLDATGCVHLWGGKEQYGEAVREEIRKRLQLTASVGIGPSRVVAKMASSLKKPDGLSIIEPERIADILGPLPVEKIPGVGRATQRALRRMGIFTVGQLAGCSLSLLRARLGVNGERLGKVARGEGGDHVIALEDRPDDKSMGHEHTFSRDVDSREVLLGRLLHLCDKATRRMRREGYYGGLVTFRLRFSDFRTWTHQRALKYHTNDPRDIYEVARELMNDLWREGDGSIRLIGVSVSRLIRPRKGLWLQEDLFRAGERQTRGRMLAALDRLRDRYGEDVLGFMGGMRSLGRGVVPGGPP